MSGPILKLNNGQEIPAIGLGTWQSKPEEVVSAVAYSLKEAGYRHIDCAWAYSNEKQVGQGIRESGVPRDQIFITSKLWGTYHTRVEEGLNETLANLGVDYLDLYLVHWPIAMNPKGNDNFIPKKPDGSRDILEDWNIADTWKQMEEMVRKGKVKSIGVSNCSEMNLNKILPSASIVPVVNQLELHVYNPQLKLLEFLKSKNIVPEAYSPLGSTGSPILSDEVVIGIAKEHGVKPADIALGYLLAKGCIVLPKSVTHSRILENFQGPNTAAPKLTKANIEKLDSLAASGKQKRFVTPPWPVDLGFDNWPKLA